MHRKVFSLSALAKEVKTADYAQARRLFAPGQTLTFNRGGDGYTDPDIYPDHVILPLSAYNDLAGYVPAQKMRGLKFSLIHDRGLYPLFFYEPRRQELTMSLDYLEYARFGRHKHTKYAERIIEHCIIGALAGAGAAERFERDNRSAKLLASAARETLAAYKNFQTARAAARRPLKIQGISLNVKSGDFAGNTAKILEALHRAKKEGVHLAVFPELIMSSYQVLDSITRPAYLEKQSAAVLFIHGAQSRMFNEDLHSCLSNCGLLKEHAAETAERMRDAAELFDEEYRRFGWTNGDYPPLNLPLKKDYLLKHLDKLAAKLPRRAELLRYCADIYADLGIACILPAALPTGGQPYNGAYVFRADGTLALQMEKQRLADDPSTYFIEKHIFKPGNPNKKYVFRLRGWNIGLSDCEDMWQESSQKIIAKLQHATGGLVQDPLLKDELCTGSEFDLNVSASPEQTGRLIPRRLDTVDWNNLPPNFYLLEGGAYTFEAPRSDTRKELISTIAAHHGTPFMYINSLGGYDNILMAGGSFIYDGYGRLLGTGRQYRDSTLTVSLNPNTALSVAPENKGDQIAPPAEQAINNLILSVADYVYKTRKTYLTFYNNGSTTALFLQRVISEAQSWQAEYIIADILRSAPGMDETELKSAKASLLQRGRLFGVKTHIMPTLNHRLLKELCAGLWSAIRNHSDVQLSVLFFPDIMLNPASLLNNPVAKTILYIFGASVIFTLAAAFLLIWPLINLSGRVLRPLGRAFMRLAGLRRPHARDSFNERLAAALQEKEKHLPPKVIFELRTMLADKEKEHMSRVARRLKMAAYAEAFFTDLLSLLRGALMWLDRKIKDAQGHQSLNIGSITGTRKNRGRFTSGGAETAGFNPAHTLAKSEIDILYLELLKKDLSRPVSAAEHLLLTAYLYRQLQVMSVWTENEKLPVKIAKNIPFIGKYFWRITPAGIKKYHAAVWKGIRALAVDDKRRAQLDKIIARLDGPLGETPLKPKNTAFHRPAEKELYWRFRPTRYNNPAPETMLARIDKYLTGKNIKQMVFLKDYIDHEKIFSWSEYAHFLAYNISRYDATRHKNTALLGPILNIKTPGSHVEILSQEADTYHSVLKEAQACADELKRIALLDRRALDITLKGSLPIVVSAGQNGWIERDYEESLLKAQFAQYKDAAYPLVIIDTLNNATDSTALRLARARNFKALVVTSPEELPGLRIPDNLTDIDYFYVFPSRTQKERFLRELQRTKISPRELSERSRPLGEDEWGI
ncbi:MAG: hypothetical protein LBD99_02685 [Candidatus Margulisbacteria bacterium]|jgi:predicted amidohydrolase|nr:hypothetical protein [Candidatus Margulisiibacteriota bacterium]